MEEKDDGDKLFQKQEQEESYEDVKTDQGIVEEGDVSMSCMSFLS